MIAVQFNMRDDGVQGEVGVSPPLAEAEVSEDYISEAGSEGVLEFAAEEEAEVVIPQHGGFREAFVELDLLSLPDHVKKRGLHHEECSTFLERTIQKRSSGWRWRKQLQSRHAVKSGDGSCSSFYHACCCTASQEVG